MFKKMFGKMLREKIDKLVTVSRVIKCPIDAIQAENKVVKWL